jgi:hypothetical protein
MYILPVITDNDRSVDFFFVEKKSENAFNAAFNYPIGRKGVVAVLYASSRRRAERPFGPCAS